MWYKERAFQSLFILTLENWKILFVSLILSADSCLFILAVENWKILFVALILSADSLATLLIYYHLRTIEMFQVCPMSSTDFVRQVSAPSAITTLNDEIYFILLGRMWVENRLKHISWQIYCKILISIKSCIKKVPEKISKRYFIFWSWGKHIFKICYLIYNQARI